MNKQDLTAYLPHTLKALNPDSFPSASVQQGKVRDIIDLGQHMVICTTDRISAFDRVLTTIPCKGQVLNQVSLYWFT
ncbi:MAG: phosphoribosylaminoimidazolesuccinocarboxamide synthase, partial [Spirochaetia bacterium]